MSFFNLTQSNPVSPIFERGPDGKLESKWQRKSASAKQEDALRTFEAWMKDMATNYSAHTADNCMQAGDRRAADAATLRRDFDTTNKYNTLDAAQHFEQFCEMLEILRAMVADLQVPTEEIDQRLVTLRSFWAQHLPMDRLVGALRPYTAFDNRLAPVWTNLAYITALMAQLDDVPMLRTEIAKQRADAEAKKRTTTASGRLSIPALLTETDELLARTRVLLKSTSPSRGTSQSGQ